MGEIEYIAKETDKLVRRIDRLTLQLGTGSSRGDDDIKDEIDGIRQQLRDIGWDEAKKKKPKKKNKDTKVASLRSSKDKKFQGHSSYRT